MKRIDFHTRIFPDKIAKPAIEALAAGPGAYRACTDGTLSGLLESMKRASLSASVVANIASKPAQLFPILEFCKQIKSEAIHPIVSFHPSNDPDDVEQAFGDAQNIGIRGVKLHPMQQGFSIDGKHMYGFYELMASFGFFVMFHAGFDPAFPGNDQADVEKLRKIADWFKDLTIVCTHLGGWKQWERIHCLRDCENVYTETSMTLPETGDAEFVKLISNFNEDRVVFGSNSPWADQKEMLDRMLRLNVTDKLKEKMLWKNSAKLLGLT